MGQRVGAGATRPLAEEISPGLTAELCQILRGGGVERLMWEARQIAASGLPAAELRAMARRRAAGEPLAYVLGEWDFYGLTLKVTPDVLIPRPDTETLADAALAGMEDKAALLDLCCGCGCIGLAIAHRRPRARVTLADWSEGALAVARENSRRFPNVSAVRRDARREPPEDWTAAFDLIVCNPPYIAQDEWEDLPQSVKAYEPRMALAGGADGLDFYRVISEKWRKVLRPGGGLFLETGYRQSAGVSDILRKQGFGGLRILRDAAGRDRVVTGRRGDI